MSSYATYVDITRNQQSYFSQPPEPDLIAVGFQKRYQAMRRRLSGFFRFTREEVQSGNPLKPKYAQNRNSPGSLTPALITLTYRDGNAAWRPDHITDFLRHVRGYAARHWKEKLRYAWVAETTKKGNIHYHIVVWLPRMDKLPKPDDKGWWPHGLSEIAGVRSGVYSYLLKYISKGCDGHGLGLSSETKSGRRQAARMFGYGGLNPRDREFLTHQMLPAYIKDIFGAIPFGQQIRRVKGGWQCGTVFVASNWESMWSDVDRTMHYKYGVSWCPLPDHLPDIFIPF